MMYYTRGKIAREAGIGFETLRFYEKQGLIKPIDVMENGYKLYDKGILKRLLFIRNAKDCGFSLEEIKKMFSIIEGEQKSKEEVENILFLKIQQIDEQISSLKSMKITLSKVHENLHSPQCEYLKALLFNSKNEEDQTNTV